MIKILPSHVFQVAKAVQRLQYTTLISLKVATPHSYTFLRALSIITVEFSSFDRSVFFQENTSILMFVRAMFKLQEQI